MGIKSTEYLFDVPRSYFEPELTTLAYKKIDTGRKLLRKLAVEKRSEDIERYTEVQESVNFWTEILKEE